MMNLTKTIAVLVSSTFIALAQASGDPRDLNGDGIADAYYDQQHDRTWLAAPISTEITGGFYLSTEAGAQDELAFLFPDFVPAFGAEQWHLPRMIVEPTSIACMLGGQWYGAFAACSFVDALSELAYIAPDFAVQPGETWVSLPPGKSYEALVTDTDRSVFPENMFPAEEYGVFSAVWWIFPVTGQGGGVGGYGGDTLNYTQFDAWMLRAGDVGVALAAPVPEPETWALLLAGLALLWKQKWERR